MATVDQITKFDNTEAYVSDKSDHTNQETEKKFDHRFSTDFLAKSIADKNNDGDVALKEYNAAKNELEQAYEAKHNNEDIALQEINNEELSLQDSIVNDNPEAIQAINDPFTYAQQNIIDKWNREHKLS